MNMVLADKCNSKIVVERLTALWALNESTLGGMMHAFKLPFTGILVGGISILLITLIALHNSHQRKTILKALTIVLIIKAGVSPYTPIAAYFAVSFQAFLAMTLYNLFAVNGLTITILSAVTFLESALQKLFTLTLIYGKSLWEAVDIYLHWIAKQSSFLPSSISSLNLIFLFVGFYFFSGLFVGFLILRILKIIQETNVIGINIIADAMVKNGNSKKKRRNLNLSFAIILIALIIPLVFFNNGTQDWQKAAYLIVRSFLVLFVWYVFLGPALTKLFNNYLLEKKKTYQTDVQNILNIIPFIKPIIYYAWHETQYLRGLNRILHFLAKTIVYSLYYQIPKI